MTIYFDIDEPIISGSAYFEVRFYLLPANTQVGSTVVVSDNLQHTVDLSEGDYRMNVLYFNGLEVSDCDNKDVLFTVPDPEPPDPPDPPVQPCACPSFLATYYPCASVPTLHVEFDIPSAANCGTHKVLYKINDAQGWVAITLSDSQMTAGFDILVPTAGEEDDIEVKIQTFCCDGSTLLCFDGVATKDTADCACDVATFTATLPSFTVDPITNVFYADITVIVTGGDAPMVLTIIQENGLTQYPASVFPVSIGTHNFTAIAAAPSIEGKPIFKLYINNDCGSSQILYIEP